MNDGYEWQGCPVTGETITITVDSDEPSIPYEGQPNRWGHIGTLNDQGEFVTWEQSAPHCADGDIRLAAEWFARQQQQARNDAAIAFRRAGQAEPIDVDPRKRYAIRVPRQQGKTVGKPQKWW